MKNHKFYLIIVLLILLALPNRTFAQHGGTGFGIILGEPTGLSFKTWISGKSAIDAGVAWSYIYNPTFRIHADYLWHNFKLVDVKQGQLPFYIGLGGRLQIQNNGSLGVRVPLGFAYIFADGHLDIFLEAVPIMDLIPATDFDFDASVGIRYFFK